MSSLMPATHPSAASGKLVATKATSAHDPRDWYLKNPDSVHGPYTSCSKFVPFDMVSHLLRNKKSSALGVKFVKNPQKPDRITNLEGALHTYVNPIVLGFIHGDYRYANGHGVVRFGKSLARQVLISAMIHPDFENLDVMMPASSLSYHKINGQDTLPRIPSVVGKQDSMLRTAYDASIKRFLIFHLTAAHSFPSVKGIDTKSTDSTILLLEETIQKEKRPGDKLVGRFVTVQPGTVLSLEFLFNSAREQVRNELLALEHICPQGYVYTYDPPSIFAERIGAKLLTRLHCAALKHVAATTAFANMRVFAFNDYADKGALALFRAALASQTAVKVMPKSQLYQGPGGQYSPPESASAALLVIHNNSDAFGQNIETEPDGTSMDGTIGANSSAAASLERSREDLLDRILFN